MADTRSRTRVVVLGFVLVASGAWLGIRAWLDAARPATSAPLGLATEDERAAAARAAMTRAAARDVESEEEASRAQLDAREATARQVGFAPPPPDTLAAVRGRVFDERTGAIVPDFHLVFLSRRPRTTHATTDANGRFETPVEIASGVVSVLHVPDPESPDKRARWTLEPSEFLLPLSTAGQAPHEITLLAKSPETVFEVQVTMPDGTPADGASVALTSGRRDERHDFVPLSRSYEVTDIRGRARFALFDIESLARSYRLEADHGAMLASELLEIDPPLGRRPQRLELAVGGSVHVTLRNDEGRPLSGVSLWLSSSDTPRFVTGRAGRTDARGECRFHALRSGCWNLTVIHPGTGLAVSRLIDLERGAEEDVSLTLSLSGLRLALEGRVVDETGSPLGGVVLTMQTPEHDPVRIESNEAGHFELWARPASGVSVLCGGGFLDDRFDPPFLTMPFGTTGLEIRRVEVFESETRAFRLVDDESGESVPRGSLVLFHGSSNPTLEDSVLRATAPRGFVQATFKPRADLRYVADAPGHVRVEGSITELAELCGPAPLPLRIEMPRGFGRRLEVRDRATNRVVAGAEFRADTTVLGRSDADGKVELSSATWPAVVRIECAGYTPMSWDPAAPESQGNVIRLEPVR